MTFRSAYSKNVVVCRLPFGFGDGRQARAHTKGFTTVAHLVACRRDHEATSKSESDPRSPASRALGRDSGDEIDCCRPDEEIARQAEQERAPLHC